MRKTIQLIEVKEWASQHFVILLYFFPLVLSLVLLQSMSVYNKNV